MLDIQSWRCILTIVLGFFTWVFKIRVGLYVMPNLSTFLGNDSDFWHSTIEILPFYSRRTMPHANLQLLASGESSDFTIICQGVEFKVHKAIICPESSFFRAACTGPFKVRRHLESSWTTANHIHRSAMRPPFHYQRKTQRSSLASCFRSTPERWTDTQSRRRLRRL